MIFKCEVIAKLDGVGVEWCEARTTLETLGHGFAYFLIWAGMVVCIMSTAAVAQGYSAWWFMLAVPCFAAVKPVMWCAWRISGKPRAICFKRGGVIESPHGLFNWTNSIGPWKATLGDIANIEVEQIVFPKPNEDVPYTHGVRMILKSGRVYHIAGNLMPDHAHELAVSLSQVREAMRYGVSAASPRARSREVEY
ncbi:MAG: hypothetical protein ABL901_03835 [Hyphomicrobiaceae bacterium]